MAKELNILVACGSGVATSTIAVNAIKEILKETNIAAKLFKCSLGELETKQNDVDLILTTANYKKPLKTHHLNVFNLVSGVNVETTKEKLIQICTELSDNE